MSAGMTHFRINGVTHEATVFESHSFVSLACEARLRPRMQVKYRKLGEGQDVGVSTPVDCMTCLVRMVPAW